MVNGRATISEGEIFFRRHTFTVKRGTLDFNNPQKTEPTVDLTAETQFKQWLITLHATGTPDNLAIRLSSDPPESDSDILSLILLGRKSNELTKGGGGTTNQQMLASLAASAWGENIKKKAGVDILEVETGATNQDDNEDRIQVTVGKKVSPRMTLKYSVETSSGGSHPAGNVRIPVAGAFIGQRLSGYQRHIWRRGDFSHQFSMIRNMRRPDKAHGQMSDHVRHQKRARHTFAHAKDY